MPELPTPIITLDPFKLAEWAGWGWGDTAQVIFRLPANTTVRLEISIPKNEIWWITFSVFGDIPSSSLRFSLEVRTSRKTRNVIVYTPTVLHEGWIGEPLCVVPDTVIVKNPEPKPISEIKVGDKVLTHKGRFREVEWVHRRHVDEDIIVIKPRLTNLSLKVTKEHPILCLRNGASKLEWVRADQIKPHDYMVYPRFKDYSLNRKASFIDENYMYFEVGDVDKEHYKGEVMNLAVKEDESYTTMLGVVKNCPPGWHRVEYTAVAIFENVTGNANYNDLPAQELFIHATLFIFKIDRNYAERIDKIIEKLTG